MMHPFKLKNAALLMALAAVYPMSAYSAAGVAQYTTGDVSVRRGAATTALAKGQPIDSGDNIVTGGQGVAQIRFTDGGLVALSPNSQFNIDRYVDDNDPAKDSFAVSFLRGGMRAISGLIGKRNRDNYKVTTSTATIGIRGSGFSARYNADGSTNVTGEQDEIVVCTNAGCINLLVGEIARVTGSDSAPSRTIARCNVPPLVPRQELFVPENPANIEPIPLETGVSGVLSGVSAMFAFGDGYVDDYPRGGEDPSDGIGTFVAGQLVKHEVPAGMLSVVYGSNVVEKTSPGAGSFGTVGGATDPGFIGWGYWDAGRESYGQPQVESFFDDSSDYAGVHYIVGRPTPQVQMPITGTAVYSLLGGTAPTAHYSGNSLLVGRLLDAGLNVEFVSGRVNGFVHTEFTTGTGQVVPVQISDSGYVYGSTFESDGYNDNDGYFYGFFTSDQAGRAGIVYEAYDYTVGDVRGAAALLRNGSAFQSTGLSALFTSTDGEFTGRPLGTSQNSSYNDPSRGTATFVGNQMFMHDDGEDSQCCSSPAVNTLYAAQSPVSSVGAVGNPADADFIGWGYWAKGGQSNYQGASALTGVHYLVGRPTPLAQMPIDGTATYSMIDGTAPTATYNGVSQIGTLLSASLSVGFNYSGGSLTANVSTQFVKNGAPVTVNLVESATINGATFRNNFNNCGGNVSGFFVGNQATRAGMIYEQNSSISGNGPAAGVGTVRGAVGLQRGPITVVTPDL